MRKTFRMCEDIHKAIRHLPRDRYGQIMFSLCEYVFYDNPHVPLDDDEEAILNLLIQRVHRKSMTERLVEWTDDVAGDRE